MHDSEAFRSASDIDQEQESITNFSSVLQAQVENETTVVEKTVVHIETSTNSEEAANKFTGERLFEVRASNKTGSQRCFLTFSLLVEVIPMKNNAE